MRVKYFFWIFILAGVSISFYYMFWGSGSDQAYVDEIIKERKDKDDFMRSSENSPFRDTEIEFEGLKYFPADTRYRIQASLTHINNQEVISLITNDGSTLNYLKYAWAEFDLDNLHHKLLLLEILEEGPERGKLFLAFADATSAVETYGAGRYLDVNKVPGAGTISLDFNNAYNPYCAYTAKFTCPFPPPENVLKVAIRAGEKVYK